jgi:hypothetical protein
VKPTAPADRAKLESDLAAALKQRDHARQNGRDSIVEIFQRDIDNIESKLASL